MKAHGWKRTTMVVLVACGIFLVGCAAGHYGSWDEQWYSAHPFSKADMMAKWGTPDQVVAHEDGTQELIYRRVMPLSGAQSAMVYQIKNDMVVKSFWKAM